MMSPPLLVAFFTGVYIVSFVAYLGVWLQPTGCHNCFENYYLNVYLTMMPFAGSVAGFLRLRHASSKPRRFVLTIFSVGLLVWAIGSVAWSYYNFRGIEIPYPSWADAGYFLQIVLWIIGAVSMFRMAGANIIKEMKTPAAWATAICTAIIAAMSWVYGDTLRPEAAQNLVKFTFDIGYPVTEIICAALFAALVFGTSRKALCGAGHRGERASYWFLVGILTLTAADFLFNFTTSPRIPSALRYYNGNWVAFLYLSALYALSLGVVLFPADEPPFDWP